MPSPIQILQTVATLDLFAAGLIMPQLPNHARTLGCTPLLVGLMGALYSGFQLLSEPMVGPLSQLKGKKVVLLLAISLSGIAYVLLGVTSSIVLFLGLRAFHGVFKHTHTLTKSIIPQYERDQSQIPLINNELDKLSGFAMCLAPIIGGHIMSWFTGYGFTIIAFIVGSIFAVNSGLIRRLPNEENKTGRKEKPEESKNAVVPKLVESALNSFIQSIEQIKKINWYTYGELFLLRLLLTFCMGLYVCNYAVFLSVKHQATSITLGLITSFYWTVSTFFTPYIGFINKFYEDDKDFSARNYHVFLTLTLSLIGMLLAPSVNLYALFIVPLAISSTVGRMYTIEVITTKIDSSQQSTALGVANTIRGVCGVLAPLVAGVVGHYVGILYVIYVCIILAALGTYRSYKLVPDVVIKSRRRAIKRD